MKNEFGSYERQYIPGKTVEYVLVCNKCGLEKGYCKCERPEFKEKEVAKEPIIKKD